MAMLAESRMLAMQHEPELEPWRGLVSAIEGSGAGSGLDYLVRYEIVPFIDDAAQTARRQLRDLFMELLFSDELPGSWVETFKAIYDAAPEVSRDLVRRNLFGGRAQDVRVKEAAAALLAHWGSAQRKRLACHVWRRGAGIADTALL